VGLPGPRNFVSIARYLYEIVMGAGKVKIVEAMLIR